MIKPQNTAEVVQEFILLLRLNLEDVFTLKQNDPGAVNDCCLCMRYDCETWVLLLNYTHLENVTFHKVRKFCVHICRPYHILCVYVCMGACMHSYVRTFVRTYACIHACTVHHMLCMYACTVTHRC